MIFGKGYMTYNVFFGGVATVAMSRLVKRNYKKVAEELDEHYSDAYLDKGLKKDFLKAGDELYKRIKKLKYKNDSERASVLKDYSDSISKSGKKKLFGGTRFNKLDSPAKNKIKLTVKSFNDWDKKNFIQDTFAKAFSGDY